MSVPFIARTSNNFEINHQLSFGYVKKLLHTTTFIAIRKYTTGICLQSANVNCSFFSESCCLFFSHGFSLAKRFLRSSSGSLLSLRLWYTHIYAYLHVSIYHTQKIHCRLCSWLSNATYSVNNCTLISKYLPIQLNRMGFLRVFLLEIT